MRLILTPQQLLVDDRKQSSYFRFADKPPSMPSKHHATAQGVDFRLIALLWCFHNQIEDLAPIYLPDPMWNSCRNAHEVAGGDVPLLSPRYARPAKFVGLRFSGHQQ